MRAVTYGALSVLLVLLVAGSAGGAGSAAGVAATKAPPAPVGAASPVASPTALAATTAPVATSPAASAVAAATSPPSATPAATILPSATPPTEWALDLYKEAGMRYQYPDINACTAAAAQISLNFISYDAGNLRWSPTVSYATMEEILKYERANMTMPQWGNGSDPHGTRNALNYYGWGSKQAGVYQDASFATFGEAATAIVSSIARTRKPAIIFTWWGQHSQVVTGYKVRGGNPATSADFTIEGMYLTDPLLGYTYVEYGGTSHHIIAIKPDTYVSLADLEQGRDAVRFGAYEQNDSTGRDPIDGNRGKDEWYKKWVVVLAAA